MTPENSVNVPGARDLPAPPKKRRLTAIALGVVILLCGAMLGSGITLVHFKRTMDVIHTPGEAAKRITDRMQRKLDLTPEQQRRVLAILRAREKSLRAILTGVEPRIEGELRKTREEVAAVLNPDQAQKWRSRFDTLHERWRRRWFPASREKERTP